jgi:hypothetical protein
VEGLHAPADEHAELVQPTAAGARHRIQVVVGAGAVLVEFETERKCAEGEREENKAKREWSRRPTPL